MDKNAVATIAAWGICLTPVLGVLDVLFFPWILKAAVIVYCGLLLFAGLIALGSYAWIFLSKFR